jgi:hypothetical protein
VVLTLANFSTLRNSFCTDCSAALAVCARDAPCRKSGSSNRSVSLAVPAEPFSEEEDPMCVESVDVSFVRAASLRDRLDWILEMD